MSLSNLDRDGKGNGLLFMGFNQDGGCFASGTTHGFTIHNCDPLKDTDIGIDGGGIGFVEPLFRCNIVALVGGGKNPKYSPNKVMIYDDNQKRCIGEMSFRSPVRAVRLRRDRVVVVLEEKIYVYNFADLRLMDHIETSPNARGLCAICPYTPHVLACPGLQKGYVRVELYDEGKTQMVPAHETAISALALNSDGTRLATASEQGTVIRIFSTATGKPLQELRRGKDRADIFSINFNVTTEWLACSSDRGTIHIFNLTGTKTKGPVKRRSIATGSPSSTSTAAASSSSSSVSSPAVAPEVISAPSMPATIEEKVDSERKEEPKLEDASTAAVKNPTSMLAWASPYLPAMVSSWVTSEWSFTQFRLPAPVPSVVAFSDEEAAIFVVCADGMFYKASFNPSTTDACVQREAGKFLKEEAKEDDTAKS